MTDTIRIRVMNLTHLPPEEAEKMWAELSPHMTLPFLMPGEELRYPPGATPPESPPEQKTENPTH